MAYASAARELAFVSEPVEVILDQGVYAYAFRRSNKERVIAIWTREDKPVNFEISLPSDSHIVDMMCNRSELKKGKNTLLLSNSPQYLTVQCENGEDAVKMLRAGMYPDAEPLKAAGRRLNAGSALLLVKSMSGEPAECSVEIPGQAPLKATLRPKEVNEITASADAGMKGNVTAKVTAAGKTLEVPLDLSYVSVKRIASAPEFDGRLSWAKGLVPVRLKTPDDIYPKAALIPERGLFKNDGTDISADLYFAWDEANLYLAAEVKDPVHIQRRGGQEMSLDDSLQFVISKRFNALPKALRSSKIVPLHTPEDYSINLTRTARGPDMVKYMGGSPNATSEFKYNVLRRDNKTVYEFAFPWDCIGLKPAPGASFLYGVMISDTNDIRHACAQYQLLFADGVRGDCRDVTLLKTMVLEK
jgi:hypothetical protein